MRTFKCDGCYEKCCVTIQFGANTPRHCHHDDNRSNWHEVKAEKVKLPKLTTEVFDHPACPVWANYASVNKNGRVIFYEDKKSPGKKGDIGFFDATDWENSLIERPTEELPEWCQADKWIYFTDINKYTKILSIDNLNKLYADYKQGCIVPARKRPFNEKEMKALVGKKLESPDWVDLILSFSERRKAIETKYAICDSKLLMDSEYTIDGKPCYKLEHQNDKGEWVE